MHKIRAKPVLFLFLAAGMAALLPRASFADDVSSVLLGGVSPHIKTCQSNFEGIFNAKVAFLSDLKLPPERIVVFYIKQLDKLHQQREACIVDPVAAEAIRQEEIEKILRFTILHNDMMGARL